MERNCRLCDAPFKPRVFAQSYCSSACKERAHQLRIRGRGPAPAGAPSDIDRFWGQVSKTDGCWLWQGTLSTGGYGRFSRNDRREQAHRVAYEWAVGPIPEGLELDHLCRNRACVNPAHLEPVPGRENLRRGVGWAGINARKTTCIKGHPLDTRLASGRRACSTCRREQNRAYRLAHGEEVNRRRRERRALAEKLRKVEWARR